MKICLNFYHTWIVMTLQKLKEYKLVFSLQEKKWLRATKWWT